MKSLGEKARKKKIARERNKRMEKDKNETKKEVKHTVREKGNVLTKIQRKEKNGYLKWGKRRKGKRKSECETQRDRES